MIFTYLIFKLTFIYLQFCIELRRNLHRITVGNKIKDRHRRGKRAGFLTRCGAAGDLPGFQGVQHLARCRPHCKALGLRVGEDGTGRRSHTRYNTSDGHARLRRTGVHNDRSSNDEIRRVQLRRGASGVTHRKKIRRQDKTQERGKAGRMGTSLPKHQSEIEIRHGSQTRGTVLCESRQRSSNRRTPMHKPTS